MSDRIAVMDEGRILQVGTPRQIYNHPTERFVADFIGSTNFLSAQVVSSNGKEAVLKLASGKQATVELPEGMLPKDKVTAVVRPEYDLNGTLENIVYVGTDTHYHVRLPDESVFVTRRQNEREDTERLEIGQPVVIEFKPNAVQVLRD